jgi:hypothetical protein
MSLRDAAAARVISDGITPSTTTIFDGAVGTVIDNAVAAAAIVSTRNKGTYLAKFDLEAVINGRTNPVEIVQVGGNLDLDDVKRELGVQGYRVSSQNKKSTSNAKDRVTFTIAWDI